MIDTILTWLSWIAEKTLQGFQMIWDAFTLLRKNIFTVVFMLMTLSWSILKYITVKITEVVERLNAINTAGIANDFTDLPNSMSTFWNVVCMANYIFPLSEGCVVVVGLVVLSGACYTYRFVKSWIPTIN